MAPSAIVHITKRFTFEAAHTLPYHNGLCARPHGHSYKLEVTIAGPVKSQPGVSDYGMVMDFADLAHLVRRAVIDVVDHRDLNEVTGCYTTAENLAAWVWDRLESAGLSGLQRVRLWETQTGWVHWNDSLDVEPHFGHTFDEAMTAGFRVRPRWDLCGPRVVPRDG